MGEIEERDSAKPTENDKRYLQEPRSGSTNQAIQQQKRL